LEEANQNYYRIKSEGLIYRRKLMSVYEQKEIRTVNARVKIGEVIIVNHQPMVVIKQGKKIDTISLNELASQLYGKEVVCKVIPQLH